MNAAYVSAIAALAGSVIGGLTTFAAAWVTQRQQANVQVLLEEKTRRQDLYQQFIEARPGRQCAEVDGVAEDCFDWSSPGFGGLLFFN